MQPYNNTSDSSFKALMLSTTSLAESSKASVIKLDAIVKNTGDTVAVLQKIHDKLDNLGSGNSQVSKPNNQSSSLMTTSPENAISSKRGASVN